MVININTARNDGDLASLSVKMSNSLIYWQSKLILFCSLSVDNLNEIIMVSVGLPNVCNNNIIVLVNPESIIE